MRPALFLDRDGVLNENRPAYVRRWSDLAVYPQALAALVAAAAFPYPIVLVTNQSAVGRGLMTLAAAEAINRRLVDLIENAGGRVDAVYLCPHAPADGCPCRKPRPGLVLQAAADLALDLPRSILIGDALSDVQAGRAAGLAHAALVRTGRGAAQERLPEAAALAPLLVYDTLAHALAALLPSPTL